MFSYIASAQISYFYIHNSYIFLPLNLLGRHTCWRRFIAQLGKFNRLFFFAFVQTKVILSNRWNFVIAWLSSSFLNLGLLQIFFLLFLSDFQMRQANIFGPLLGCEVVWLLAESPELHDFLWIYFLGNAFNQSVVPSSCLWTKEPSFFFTNLVLQERWQILELIIIALPKEHWLRNHTLI